MKIESVEIYRYTLPLVETMEVKDHTLVVRFGLLLKLTSADGAVGHGEIAPLPGYSLETLEEAAREAALLCDGLNGQPVPDGLEKLDGGFEAWLGQRVATASVRCGIEFAVLYAMAAERGIPLRRLIAPAAPNKIAMGGLLSGNLGEIRKKAIFLVNEGFRAVKLKVGRYDVPTDVQSTVWLREHLGGRVALRLDANRAWDFDTAVAFARETTKCAIDFIEEPVQDPGRLTEFAESTGMKIGLDETLQEMTPDAFRPWPNVKALVLKPTVLGLEKAVRLARKARENGIVPVISSTFESGFGLISLAQVAAAVQPEGVPSGLDTYEWLDEDVLRERAPLRSATLDLGLLDSYIGAITENRLENV